MNKIVCAFLIFTMIIFLVNPLSKAASRGHSVSGHSISNHSRGGYWRGGYWGWWAPWEVIGGASVLAPYYYDPYYYSPYYEPPLVVDQEQSSVDVQPVPSLSPSTAERIFIYPRKGQSEELQAKDRYECHRWGVSQTGYDPTQPTSGMSGAQLNQMRVDYKRAMSACLDGRGYTMK